jgi:hypothetical protein
MQRTDEQLHYIPEQQLKEEGLRKVGVAVLIVDVQTGKLWTITETKNKPSTKRASGTITPPLETRKRDESIMNNTIGALAEFRPLKVDEKISWVNGESYKGRFLLTEGVAADLVFLALDHKEDDLAVSTNTTEVSSGKWMTIEELLKSDTLRTGVEGILKIVEKQEWIEQFTSAYLSSSTEKMSLGKEFNLKEFMRKREQREDIEL